VRGGSPAAMKLQVPGAETVLQDLQFSVHALLQQTLSTQKPLAQSASQPQLVPFVFLVPASCEQEGGGPSTPPSCLGEPCEDE
jgi:hypothetical protein